eukprot:jgi/Psemu1/34271/gm1.34271_g
MPPHGGHGGEKRKERDGVSLAFGIAGPHHMDSSMCSSAPDPEMWIIQGTLAWRTPPEDRWGDSGEIQCRSNFRFTRGIPGGPGGTTMAPLSRESIHPYQCMDSYLSSTGLGSASMGKENGAPNNASSQTKNYEITPFILGSLVQVQDGPAAPGKRIEEASDYFRHAPLGSGGYSSVGRAPLLQLGRCDYGLDIPGEEDQVGPCEQLDALSPFNPLSEMRQKKRKENPWTDPIISTPDSRSSGERNGSSLNRENGVVGEQYKRHGERPVAESITSLRSDPSSMGHVESRVNQQGPPCKAKYSWWRSEPTDVEKSADELWLGVKCHSNPELAGSPRNASASETVGDKLHRREGNSPDHQLRPLNDRSVIKEVGVQRQPGGLPRSSHP